MVTPKPSTLSLLNPSPLQVAGSPSKNTLSSMVKSLVGRDAVASKKAKAAAKPKGKPGRPRKSDDTKGAKGSKGSKATKDAGEQGEIKKKRPHSALMKEWQKFRKEYVTKHSGQKKVQELNKEAAEELFGLFHYHRFQLRYENARTLLCQQIEAP